MALPLGVPALLDASIVFLDPLSVLSEDVLTSYGIGATPQWGIYLNGTPVVIADTITDFGYQQQWTVADYPVERGGFESYDKVNTPFRIKMQFASGDSEANRTAMLASIAAIGDTLDKYDIITPTAVYTSVNVEGYEYHRTATNGLGLLKVDMQFLEIRESQANDFQNTTDPSAYQAAPQGNVQSTTTDITVRPLSGVQ